MSTIRVAVAGSSGSIGTQTLDVVRAEPDRFEIVGLGVSSSVDVLVAQALEFRPKVVVVADPAKRAEVAERLPFAEVRDDMAALAEDADVVINGVVGFAGLSVTVETLRLGKRLALANKESLIAGGPVVRPLRSVPGAELVPVDSEHCAIHQCLRSSVGPDREVAKLILTASGGPFRGRTRAELAGVTVNDALAHPTWKMGPKITVDSSTLMNKGLEVIEAHELFGVDFDRIDVVVHPQSIVHSMVEFTDAAVIAQLSLPDMRLPIGYALAYPERLGTPFGRIDWDQLRRLDFDRPDLATFRCLGLAFEAGRIGGSAPAWLNAANEVAVQAFLDGLISWIAIADVLEETLSRHDGTMLDTVESVIDVDRRGRAAEPIDHRSEMQMTDTNTETSPTPGAPSPGPWAPPDPASAARLPFGSSPPFVPGQPVASLSRLFLVLGAMVAVALLWPWVFLAVMAIGVMIFLHELGHFITARRAGMKVTEFFIGFGPRIWSFRRGEVEYGLKAIPAGAYVRIIGMSNLEQVDPADEARTYRQQPYWRRLSVAVAGSVMHFILALLCLLALFIGYGRISEDRWHVSTVVTGSAAASVGLQEGDRIVSIDGTPVATFEDLRPALQDKPGQQVTLLIDRNGTSLTLTPTLGTATDRITGEKVGFLGVGPVYGRVRESVPAAVVQSFKTFGVGTWETVKGIGGIFTPGGISRITDSFKSTKSDSVGTGTTTAPPANDTNDRPQSIIGIVRNSSDAAQAGLATFLGIFGSVNLAIGLLNLLPTLPLDGGHVVIATYERIRSRKGRRYYADVTKMLPLAYVTVMVLVVLGFVTMFLDVARPVSLFP